ncbi:MAG: hypothetical protein QG633_80 [Patescibacteria group bacterium]|nr:hypothetical protein [Patescibacteria group bacterium]
MTFGLVLRVPWGLKDKTRGVNNNKTKMKAAQGRFHFESMTSSGFEPEFQP